MNVMSVRLLPYSALCSAPEALGKTTMVTFCNIGRGISVLTVLDSTVYLSRRSSAEHIKAAASHVCAEAVLNSNVEGSDETAVAKVMAAIADRVTHDMASPYTFPSTHRRLLEPYDYYAFGQASNAHLSSMSAVSCVATHNDTSSVGDAGLSFQLL